MFPDEMFPHVLYVSSPDLLPDWLPDGWESSSFPLFDELLVILQWFGRERAALKAMLDNPEYVLAGADICTVRDAYRMARYLQTQRGWGSPPAEPQRSFTTPDDLQAVLSEIERVRGWIVQENRKSPKRPSAGNEITFSVQEVADYVGVDRKTIERWVKDGKVRATDDGWGKYRFSIRKLDMHKEAQCGKKTRLESDGT